MSKKIIFNTTVDCYNTVLLEDNEIIEYHQTPIDSSYQVGDIYLGTIKRMVPSLNAAFVGIGHAKSAFLHYSDLSPHILSIATWLEQITTTKKAVDIRKSVLQPLTDKQDNIQDILKIGQKLIVQISKEAIHSKGLRISSLLTLAGQYLILMPFNNQISVSTKITNTIERLRLTSLASAIQPKNFGLIIRTAAQNKSVSILYQELQYLLQKWEQGVKKLTKVSTGTQLISEEDHTSVILRNIRIEELEKVIVDDKKIYKTVNDYIKRVFPKSEQKLVYLYQGKKDVLEYLNLQKKLQSMFGTIIPIKGGGYLVIQQTEALCVIDVNTGSCVAEGENQEEIAFHVNMVASKVIARQLRFRDIGGIIVVDFVSMHLLKHKRTLYKKMKDYLAQDSAKSEVLPLSKFCLMEITRSRVRPAITIQNKEICPTCYGNGKISSAPTLLALLEGQLKLLLLHHKLKEITLQVHPYFYAYLREEVIGKQWDWCEDYWKTIQMIPNESLAIPNYKILNKRKEVVATNPQLTKESVVT